MKPRLLLLLPLAVSLLSAGCASNRPLVSAWRDPHFSPTPADTIALTSRPLPGPGDAELQHALVAELQHAGFRLAPPDQADYTLAFAVEDEGGEIIVPASRIVPQSVPPTRILAVPGAAFEVPGSSAEGPQQLPAPPAATDYVDKGIRLFLYANPKTHPGGLQTAWEGCIDAGHKISTEREPVLLRTLLAYFGRDYTGRVSLAK
ncbi:MAG: hypothetical protein KGJ60_00445 [Verrucomicrobiota bacterium]|nr:hypothetical protein [Verrucomicrobiota bacterium]